jgi:heptose I phosphotransferase
MTGWWRRLTAGTRRLVHRADWPAFVGPDWADRIMGAAITDRFYAKQGRSTGRWILEGPAGRLAVYLKRFRKLPWRERLLATLWPGGGWSPGMTEYRHLLWAQSAGIPVPAPVAAGEFIGPWGRLESFLAVEELADMLPLHEAIPAAAQALGPGAFERWKRDAIRAAAAITRRLHDARRFHKDLYLCHFFARPQAATGMYLIDLHRLGHHPWMAWRWRVKDLAQLLFSSDVAGVTDRDRWRFFRHYRGGGRWTRADHWLKTAVLLKAGRYRRHNARLEAA